MMYLPLKMVIFQLVILLFLGNKKPFTWSTEDKDPSILPHAAA